VIESATSSAMMNFNTLSRSVFDVGGQIVGTVQVNVLEGSVGSVAVAVQRSNDGVKFYALESATTASAEGLSVTVNATGFRYLAVVVTTVAGGTCLAEVTVHTKDRTS